MTNDLAAALLRDVPRYDAYDVMMTLDGHPLPGGCAFGKWVRHADVLSALITALLAQNAALRAERDELAAELHTMKTAGIIEVAVRNPSVADYVQHWEGRTEAAEAKVEKLRGALEKIASAKDLEAPSEYNRGWNNSRSRLRDVARAALTTEADNE